MDRLSAWTLAIAASIFVGGCAEDLDSLADAGLDADLEPRVLGLPAWDTGVIVAGPGTLADRSDRNVYGFTPPVPAGVTRLPAEFEPVEEFITVWSDDIGDTQFFTDMIVAVHASTPTKVLVPPALRADAERALTAAGVSLSEIEILETELDSVWVRDYGPLVVETGTGEQAVVDARYYEGRVIDDRVPDTLGRHEWGRVVMRPNLEFEGGILLSDGTDCVTTERLLTNNDTLEPTAIEEILRTYYGCRSTVFVPPVPGDSTGHIDMLAYVTGPKQILVGEFGSYVPPALLQRWNGAIVTARQRLDEATRRLEQAGWNVTRLPMPLPELDPWFRLRTYSNALVVNEQVLVPVYGDTVTEADALDAFADAFPNHDIVPIDSDIVIESGGAVHCTTMTVARRPQDAFHIGMRWTRLDNGSYQFTALAPPTVARVEFFVDGWPIGTGHRFNRNHYAIGYTFNGTTQVRQVEARGFDAQNRQIAIAVGSLDRATSNAPFVRQVAGAAYEVGFDRPSAAIDHLSVRIDGFDPLDWYTRSSVPAGTEATYVLQQFGTRTFRWSALTATGSTVTSAERTMSLP